MRRRRRRWARPARVCHQRLDRVSGGRQRRGRARGARRLGDRSRPRQCQPSARRHLHDPTAVRSGAGGVRPGARGQPERCQELSVPWRRADVVRRPGGAPSPRWRRRRGSIPASATAVSASCYYLVGRYGDAVAMLTRGLPSEPAPYPRAIDLAVLAAAYAQLGDADGGRADAGPSWRRSRPFFDRDLVLEPVPLRGRSRASARRARQGGHRQLTSLTRRHFMGLLDRRPMARPLVRHRRIRRPVRAQCCAVPQLGDGGRQPRPVGRGRLQGRAGALPSLRLARLPVGAPDADLPQAQGAGGR